MEKLADLGEASQDSDVNGALGNVLGYMKKMVGLLKEGDGGGGWLNPNNWFAGGGKLGGWINGHSVWLSCKFRWW